MTLALVRQQHRPSRHHLCPVLVRTLMDWTARTGASLALLSGVVRKAVLLKEGM